MQGPGETGETWTYPSMVLVPLCTAMVMAWSLQGELRFPLATFHYHSLPPASQERKLRLSFLPAHCSVVKRPKGWFGLSLLELGSQI